MNFLDKFFVNINKIFRNKSGEDAIEYSEKYKTYNNLSPKYSAYRTLTYPQKVFFTGFLLLFLISLVLDFSQTVKIFIGIITLLYFADFLFTLLVIIRSFGKNAEIRIDLNEISEIDDSNLPLYTILCPLYKEKEILEQFIQAIEIIDWPKDKLEVILLLEEDDRETINKAYDLNLPSYFKIEIVPNFPPRTKPKACNWGLMKANGQYLVVYDAEDKPDPLQLKKAFLAFQKVDEKVICLQSKLNYYNSNQNFLTRLFTAEYSYWFEIALPGIQSFNTLIPLGGTSNHFKTKVLREIGGWDPFNVTEDCDLGTRLFKMGYRTSIVDSETLEEANSSIRSWIKQRSRWIKGYLQTYLVHMRNPLKFLLKSGYHVFLFQLIIGARMVFILINPILWFLTTLYFTVFFFYFCVITS